MIIYIFWLCREENFLQLFHKMNQYATAAPGEITL